MKKTLYLMRHGQTLFNQRSKIQGWSDSPLTPEGIRQAHIASKYFKDHNIIIDRAYASTQERASDTLEIITNLPYQRLKGIKEWNFGVFEGESEDLNPIIREHESSYGDFFLDYGGESADYVQERMNQTLTEIMNDSDAENVLAVSHGGAMFMFFQKWENLVDHPTISFSNCCITKFEFENNTFKFVEIINHDLK